MANQIAAGEVVERPASVVKELVENSLDAGASLIQIEIEKGGAQLIRIRDNGCGIGKQDLSLALARHATSKIASLEDLEMILSLGFRGEALASISSVSRLTLTSRPAYQTEAWQAYAQGREMAVEIQPASHPVGTTIEVANLFFNTPARRKFLRTDKTEFAHIDEVVRRIALAKPNVTFILSHNDKKIRHYKAVADQSLKEQEKRVAAICGEDFVAKASHLDWQHGDLHLHGWIGLPNLARPQNDLCYSYVNGRMMRDKTINHAIRQAYGDSLPKDHYPAFVLFLDLDPSQVDVNVHPAKHEVRFHQGRLVHDFIYQGVLNTLEAQTDLPLAHQINEPVSSVYQASPNRAAAGQNIFTQPYQAPQAVENSQKFASPAYPARRTSVSKSAQKWYGELVGKGESSPLSPSGSSPASGWSESIAFSPASRTGKVAKLSFPPPACRRAKPPRSSSLHPPAGEVPKAEGGGLEKNASTNLQKSPNIEPLATSNELAQVLAVVQNKALLLKQGEAFYLLSLQKLAALKLHSQLKAQDSQALLIPLNLQLNAQESQAFEAKHQALTDLGFVFQHKRLGQMERITVNQVPRCLREQNLQQLLLGALQAEDLDQFFANFAPIPTVCSLAEGIALLAEVEQACKKEELEGLMIEVDFGGYLEQI
ncbi:DNA mismatch repair protein MutL [Pasteurellaceae bacterium RH1A]|nr:DNA mismatch repair protein MutL [Pasteurellaceae bacterium RH1A]